ncbi:tenascin-X [Pyxidicoccus fallax]|uniref:Tenascin-X n=1 Tax=Pyxidicoccus fallax TaxID=394095 RepID=A0A848LIV3_9BACT|nr:tenascin-X [Pyxidicoccus fallax]NMO17665.1 tenascin-X [Pyxidicoccus fallax]NPC78647.1 tenascin-X [Pyxidicoccus fallax]
MARATRAGVGRAVILLALVLGAGIACRDEPPLKGAVGRLRLSGPRLEFPAAYPGTTREAEVRVVNAGRAPLDVTWTEVAPPFALVDALPTRVASGEVPVRLRFAPTAVGTYTSTVTGTSSDGGKVELVLAGEGKPIPDCFTPVTCSTATFDVATEQCVETVLPDGTPCDPGNACLTDATCQAGRCKGRERACDDGNLCTTDVCHALDGCQSVPAPPCPGDGKCQVGTCDPQKGCGLAPAPDGTFCGSERGCDVADLCVEGACVRRNPPDGFVCATASPCQGEGRCEGSVCERPAAVPLEPDWQYDSRFEGQDLHDLLVSPRGEVTLSGFYGFPVLDAAGEGPVRSNQTGRRCMLWNDRLLCMDLPEDGTVSLMERSTGAPRWTFTLGRERPDFAQKTLTLFLARLAVMAPDRLAALFEAYPAGQNRDTLCRMYFLVVLDAFGRMVSAQELTDPLLSECNHPHPFGLASDTRGNLYVSFARTMNVGAPLASGSPTLMMAFSPDGVPRWRTTRDFRSGELAVVNGLLMPEYGAQALSTEDGSPVASIAQAFGRVVATREVAVPSTPGTTVNGGGGGSLQQATQLQGFGLPGLEPAWTYSLRDGQNLFTKELRLGTWPAGTGRPRDTVVLSTAMGADAQPMLVAVRVKDGSEAFQCPLSYSPRGVTQLMELAPDAMVMMDGATTCGECDPPFANSRARFLRFPMPGLLPASEPWPGTFGGPGHGHHENSAH